MIRILLVDDQNIIWQGLQALFRNRPQLEMVGYATNGKDALQQVAILRPDIVLIDIEMPEMNGIVATQKICQQFPQSRVIIFSSHEDPIYAIQSLQAGAKGYLLKQTLFEDLEKAIELVHHGYSQIESKILTKAIEKTQVSRAIASKTEKTFSSKPKKVLERNSVHRSTSIPVGSTANYDRLNSQVTSWSIKPHPATELSPPSKSLVVKTNSAPQAHSPQIESKLDADSCHESQANGKNHAPSQSSISLPQEAVKTAETKNLAKSKKYLWLLIGLAIAGSTLAIAWLRWMRPVPQPSGTPAVSVAIPQIETVVALGRIEPLGRVISLSAPTSLEAVKVERLLVEEDDAVEVGQIIAILDGRQRLQAALDEAVTGVEISQARLEQVKAGAKPSSILAREAAIANLKAELIGKLETQQATIARLTAQVNNARSEQERYQMLYETGAVSASELDSRRLTTSTAQEQLNGAQATLKQTQSTLEARIQEAIAFLAETKEVRDVDLQLARAELNQAESTVNKAQSDMELAYVRTPMAGQVLAIHTRPGESPGQNGIVEIGKTEQMMVVAEVDQNDIKQVEIGQQATVTSGIFEEKLKGKVHQISSQIGKNDILDTDPTADEDTRVVEVQILLEPQSSQKVTKLTNLEVDVTIEV